tara:strand:- start:965 stop:2254 length:1290 start_codon:yes stop_codon:yes gene_type:complete
MKKILLTLLLLYPNNSLSDSSLSFYIDKALSNNLKLNAERKAHKANEQEINISRGEFLPNLTISGTQTSSETFNRTDSSGTSLNDTNLNTEKKSINVEQKIFQGFQGYNLLKKSKLEVEKSFLELKLVEQNTILETSKVYFDLILKSQNKEFNENNVSLFERQVESDRARLQKGEITLTDLAQSESSLAGANAQMIIAETDLQNTRVDFEKIIGVSPPNNLETNYQLNIKLPISLSESLDLAKSNNQRLLIAAIDYQIANRELNIEKSKLSPSATLNYSKSETNQLSSTVDETDEEKLEAKISWPIIKGGKNFSSIKKSNLKKQESKLLLENIEKETSSDTTNAWSNFKSAESVLNATKAQLEAAEIANEGITLEYDSSNTRTTLELIQSRSLLLNARISNANAQRNLIISKIELLSQIGNLAPNFVKD